MKEQILEILKKENGALDIHTLARLLNAEELEKFKQLIKELNELEESLEVYRTNKDKYMLFENSNLRKGILIGKKGGYAFVDVENEEDIFISYENFNDAISGDVVIAEITKHTEKGLEGRIVRVVERKQQQFVGEYYQKGKDGIVQLDDASFNLKIFLAKEDRHGLVDGHKVLVKLHRKIKNNEYYGKIVKIIGHKDDPGIDITTIAYKHGIEEEFPQEVIDELQNIPDSVSEEEIINRLNHNGRDLREETIFTIDDEKTKDIDDAISIKKMTNGNYELGVHIADVSYYVKVGSALYEEALKRGTSVYLADRVIPMLPHQLSNGICSLNEGEDRLTQSCVMEIDPTGEIVHFEIFESVIRSKKKMTYQAVNQLLEQNKVCPGYEAFQDDLYMMKELASILRKHKIEKGYIDFDIDEPTILVDEEGKAIDVVLRERGTGEKLIEDFMIAANETVASCIYNMDLPFIYRVHGEPSKEKIDIFLHFIATLGYKIEGKIRNATPKEMQKLLESLQDKKEYHILSKLLLRCMQKAVYDDKNIGHFGLASSCYTHFTSPIRRFPDTTVHRLLREYLYLCHLSKDNIDYLSHELPVIAEHSSEKERDSVECEREVTDMKMAEYMEDHIGEIHKGMINTVTKYGFYVELPNLIEGLVSINTLTDDHYIYDEESQTLRGKKNVRGYRLGDNVEIIVISAKKEEKQIDFVLNTEENRKLYGK